MQAYILMEDNGESYEDHRNYPVGVFLDESKAHKAMDAFNESRKTGPIILSEEEWIKSPHKEWEKTYDDYVEDIQNDWIYVEQHLTQSVRTFEITEN
jgi:hypothetical protein